MTWYIKIGTEAVPGFPVATPVTVVCGGLARA
jgi:hypothetical protein